MEPLQKVLWHEGMFLTPVHFQQWDRQGEAERQLQAALLQPLGRGLAGLELDGQALANQSVALRRAAGAFPDGTVFDMPRTDALPQARHLGAAFDASRKERLGIYLALPAIQPGVALCDDPERPSPSPVRFRRQTTTVRDAVPGGSDREIATLAKELTLRLEGESLDGFTTLKIAEVARDAGGGCSLVETYIPPCLSIGAAPAIQRILRRVVDILGARSSDLAKGRRQRTQGLVEFSVSETANYFMLHTVNGALPGLMHLLDQGTAHPERLYLELARLAGQLLTHASEGHARDLPPYRHDDLASTYLGLEQKLRQLLETSITIRYVPLPLTRSAGGVHTARLPEAVLEGHRLYLSVLSSAPTDKIVNQTALKAKIGASTRVNQLMAQALKGVGLTYLSVPPADIPAQPGTSYFELQRSGEEWPLVLETRTLGIFLPPDFTDLKMEFMAVKDNG
jgi:type VI secretion system protein ImpJ